MKKGLIIIYMLCMSLNIFSQSTIQQTNSYQIFARLLVFDQREISQLMNQWTDDMQGYFLQDRSDYFSARIPVDKVDAIKPFLENLEVEIISYDLSAFDRSQELASARSALKAREEVLERNQALLNRADFSATLAIEREVVSLISEIERFRAQINRLETEMSYAMLTVYFTQEELAQLNPQTAGSFDWFNELDFYNFIVKTSGERGFSFGPGFDYEAPRGFAQFKSSKEYFGISYDSVLLQIKQIKNEPQMNTDFWSEALDFYLQQSGYIPRAEKNEIDEFILFEWIMPYAGEDYIYLTAFKVEKNELILVKCAGKAENYIAVSDAVKKSLETIR
jgi:hypothetical protein